MPKYPSTKEIRMTNDEFAEINRFVLRASCLIRIWVVRHSSFFGRNHPVSVLESLL